MGMPEIERNTVKDYREPQLTGLSRDEILGMIRACNQHLDSKILLLFTGTGRISCDCIATLAAMYGESMELGIDIYLNNAPVYIQQVFPDFPNVELPSPSSYSDYQLVLVYRSGKFDCEYMCDEDNTGNKEF